MLPRKIHLLGAPGSGVSTLGRALAQQLGYPYFDVDDFYWFTSDPLPYKRKRNPDHRRSLLKEALSAQDKWVLGGALCGWGDEFIPQFDLVVFCQLPAQERLLRIRARESARYGEARIAPGGDLHLVFEKFCRWAADYETDPTNIRSLAMETAWLKQLPGKYVVVETGKDVEVLVEGIFLIDD